MNISSITNLRRQDVAKHYCKTMAIIDDEIFEEGNNRALSERFHSILQSCQQDRILCHLYQYPKEPDAIKTRSANMEAVDLAKSADVVVLDWWLGTSSPINCITVLKDMLKGPRLFRYVVIYTNQELARVDAELKSSIKGLEEIQDEVSTNGINAVTPNDLHEEPNEDITVSANAEMPVAARTILTEDANLEVKSYHLDRKFFISVERKSAIEVDSSQLLPSIQKRLLESFPDHLHWAGLEVAGRARELVLRVIAALPPSIDKALHYQAMYQNDDEVSHQVAEILMEELRFALLEKPLKVVKDDVLLDDLKQRIQELVADESKLKVVAGQPEVAQDQVSEIALYISNLSETWKEPKLRFTDIRNAIKSSSTQKYFPYGSENEEGNAHRVIADYIRACPPDQDDYIDHIRWAAARESVILKPTGKMETGYIVEKLNSEDQLDRWFLCITPLCDCAHPKEGYLFVKGEGISAENMRSSRRYETQSCFIYHANADSSIPDAKQIGWFSDKVRFLEKSETDDQSSYRIVGALRMQFINRIINRVFGWQSRVGVDTDELLRMIRAE